MFALLGRAGRLGLRAKRARRGDQASAAHPARTHQGFERVGVTETHRRKQRHSRLTQPQFLRDSDSQLPNYRCPKEGERYADRDRILRYVRI